MVLNSVPGHRAKKRQRPPSYDQVEFDFVVAERPKYIPGSGPPLAPIGIMPIHDKDGIILLKFEISKGQHRYVVSYDDKPYLKVSVKPENILDWVSPLTFETWEYEHSGMSVNSGEEEDSADPNVEVGDQKQKGRKRKKRGGSRAKSGKSAEDPKASQSKKRKFEELVTMPPPSGPIRKRPHVEEEPALTKRPSLTSPSKQRGLAVPVPQYDDSEDDAMALLDRQLNGSPFGRSGLAVEVSRSPTATTSPEPVPRPSSEKSQKGKNAAATGDSKQKVQPSRSTTRSASISDQNDIKSQRSTRASSSASIPAVRKDSVASTSSREARTIYEELERKNGKQTSSTPTKTIAQKYSNLGKNKKNTSSRASGPKNSAPPSPQPEDVEEQEEEEEYEVDAILAHENRVVDNMNQIFYLIKWVGDWPDSWEPAGNVGSDVKAEYKQKLKKRQVKTIKAHEDRGEGDKDKCFYLVKWHGDWPDSWEPSENLEMREKKAYRKKLKEKGAKERDFMGIGDADAEDDASVDEDSLFVTERPRPRKSTAL